MSAPAGQALHTIIVEKDAEFSSLREYFHAKRDNDSLAVPKPILSGQVISVLSNKIKNAANLKICIPYILYCLREFSSNHEVQDPWCKFHKEISKLIFECFIFFHDSSKNGSFLDHKKLFISFCDVMTSVAGKSNLLCAELFNRCSKDMLTLLCLQNGTHITAQLKSVTLKAISAVCQYAPSSDIAETFSSLEAHLNYLAKQMLNLPVESQMDAYIILDKFLDSSKKHVEQKTAIWFAKWPVLEHTFNRCHKMRFAEGCGIFLGELYQVKTSGIAKPNFSNRISTRSPHEQSSSTRHKRSDSPMPEATTTLSMIVNMATTKAPRYEYKILIPQPSSETQSQKIDHACMHDVPFQEFKLQTAKPEEPKSMNFLKTEHHQRDQAISNCIGPSPVRTSEYFQKSNGSQELSKGVEVGKRNKKAQLCFDNSVRPKLKYFGDNEFELFEKSSLKRNMSFKKENDSYLERGDQNSKKQGQKDASTAIPSGSKRVKIDSPLQTSSCRNSREILAEQNGTSEHPYLRMLHHQRNLWEEKFRSFKEKMSVNNSMKN